MKEPEGQLARWLERLGEYNFVIIHRPGRLHNNADSLSRRLCPRSCPCKLPCPPSHADIPRSQPTRGELDSVVSQGTQSSVGVDAGHRESIELPGKIYMAKEGEAVLWLVPRGAATCSRR